MKTEVIAIYGGAVVSSIGIGISFVNSYVNYMNYQKKKPKLDFSIKSKFDFNYVDSYESDLEIRVYNQSEKDIKLEYYEIYITPRQWYKKNS